MSLETSAKAAWRDWAAYRKHGLCQGCDRIKYVGRALRGRRWLCVDCWDQGEE